MRHAQVVGRLGALAVGLGVGTMAAGAASADDGSTDPLGPVADAVNALGATPAPLDLSVSIDGTLIFQEGTAHAFSGTNDMAIAIGPDAQAAAGSSFLAGQFDFALADGANSNAASGPGNFDVTSAFGTRSEALAGAGNFDTAFANGTNSFAESGGNTLLAVPVIGNNDFADAFGTYSRAEAGALAPPFTVPSSNDVAIVVNPIGNSFTDISQGFAGNGNFDVAEILGNHSLVDAGLGGNSDLAGVLGDGLDSTTATGANFLSDFLDGPLALP